MLYTYNLAEVYEFSLKHGSNVHYATYGLELSVKVIIQPALYSGLVHHMVRSYLLAESVFS